MGGKTRVVIIPCENYDEERVYEKMKRGIELLGGMEQFVKPCEKILVKPNFLLAAEADRTVTTNPAVIRGMLRILQESGCTEVKFGDSPGHGSCRSAVEKLGIDPDVATYGAVVADMSQETRVEFPEGKTCKEFYFAQEVVWADAIINLCKMKTHALEKITGGVKNLYGLVCGYRKAAGHVSYPNEGIFARMLVDIHRCVKPRLHIMDGIAAMEGNGPNAGVRTDMKVLLFSADPVALDTVFCNLIDLNPKAVPTNVHGESMGLGTCDNSRIEIIDENGEELSKENALKLYGNPKFDVQREEKHVGFLSKYASFRQKVAKRPTINKDKCVKCGVCVSHCPVDGKALSFKNGRDLPPVYDYSKCIRCYCCQEMCPKRAIEVRGRK